MLESYTLESELSRYDKLRQMQSAIYKTYIAYLPPSFTLYCKIHHRFLEAIKKIWDPCRVN